VLSYQVGSLKPAAEIFERAIALSGHHAEALFFTDDRAENIVAAKALGMRAHQFQTESRLIEALQAEGIEMGDSVHR
jgi:FMN phosphatase YigB (HAD superfamily)